MIATEAGAYVDVGGINTYYVKKGTGPAVVMLHGQAPGACVSVIWGANIDAIADAGYTVYALDETGFGRTDNSADCSIETRIAHVQGFLEAMGLDRYTLWGHSDGSYIACSIALKDPKVERLILMASGSLSPAPPNQTDEDRARAKVAALERESYTPSLENARESLSHSIVNEAALTEELIREYHEASTGKNAIAYQSRLEMPKRRIYNDLHALKVPVLMLWGSSDSGGPARGLALFEKIPGAELHIFSDCAHWVQRDQTDRVHSLAVGFLQSH